MVSHRAVISIHALREESDLHAHGVSRFSVRISIHALREESDKSVLFINLILNIFQSTLSVRRATISNLEVNINGNISIHALREESDVSTDWLLSTKGGISIHALREESDKSKLIMTYVKNTFQSTLSVRRATRFILHINVWHIISIHALREESDSLISTKAA